MIYKSLEVILFLARDERTNERTNGRRYSKRSSLGLSEAILLGSGSDLLGDGGDLLGDFD